MTRAGPRPQDRPRIAAGVVLVLLAGCGTLGHGTREGPLPADTAAATEAEAVRAELLALDTFLGASPAVEAELLESARVSSETVPSSANRLHYALLLAMPGAATSDPVAARRQLSELLARPEWHSAAERALAACALANVEERLLLAEDARQAGLEAATRGQEKVTALQHRLQAESEETARLRHALEDAQKKIEVLTQLERSITASPVPPQP